ncbi:mannosyltransferase [Kineococcus xinjiangensis]|uniref:Mannosyltransferase n=1 Tax=Kineococcus xinjiangensis TaxID=512762 RepID=A0A2S6IE71_9ACTN|nr:hypothetical protein [Kineococcus xinjiangensis]PPK92486.1 mannosyltransferase [Kineococcus xinjiangensis]
MSLGSTGAGAGAADGGGGAAPAVRRRPDRGLLCAWLVPALVAALTTAWRYDAKPLWRDEFYTLGTAVREYGVMLRGLRVTDAGMGPWYVLMRPWVLLSQSEAWLRLPSAVAGVLAAALAGLLAHHVVKNHVVKNHVVKNHVVKRHVVEDSVLRAAAPLAGAVAGVLFTLTPIVVRHSQEARPYPVLAACAVATAYGLLRDRGAPRARWLLLWAAAATLAAALHVLTGAPAVLAMVGVAFLAPGRARRRRFLAGGLPPLAVAAAMVAVGMSQAPNRIGEDFPLLRRSLGLWHSYAAAPAALGGLLLLWGAGALALRRCPPVLALLAAGTLAPVAAVVASAAAGQLFEARYTVAAAPALAVLAGVGAAGIAVARRRTAPTAVAALALVGLVAAGQAPRLVAHRQQPFVVDDPRSAAAALAARARPGDAVVFLGNTDRPMLRHHLPAGVGLDDVLLVRDPSVSVSIGGDDLTGPQRAAALAGRERVWVVGTEHFVPWEEMFAGPVRDARAGRALAYGESFGRFRVELWTAP